MFSLFMLLLIPILITVLCSLISHLSNSSKYKITLKEFLCLEGWIIFSIVVAFFIAKNSNMRDVELLNGTIVHKEREEVPCVHSYSCPPCWETCTTDSEGHESCTEHCSTCYEHEYDVDWNIYINYGMMNDVMDIKRIDRQGIKEPPRWTEIQLGDPSSRTHVYDNYLKASPDSILVRHGGSDKYKKLIPAYPINIYDYYKVNRFINMGINITNEDIKWWNTELMKINSNLGPKKQVNIIIVTVSADPDYVFALEEAWIGGKKNDFIVVLSVTSFPKIDWVRVISWTSRKDLMIEIRDEISNIGNITRKEEISNLIKSKIEEKFVRRKMAEFDFLLSSIKPSPTALKILWVLSVLQTIGLVIFFWVYELFDTHNCYQRRRSR